MSQPREPGRILGRNPDQYIRPFIESHFPRYIESIMADVQSELATAPNRASILEIGFGRGDLTLVLVKAMRPTQMLSLAELNSKSPDKLRGQLAALGVPNVQFTSVEKGETTHDLIFMHNPDGSLLDLETPSRIQKRLTPNGKIIIYRDFQVDAEGVRLKTHFDNADGKNFRPEELVVQVRQFKSSLTGNGPAREPLNALIDEHGNLLNVSRLDPRPVRTNNYFSMLEGHMYEWARIVQIYQKSGFRQIETTYHSVESFTALEEMNAVVKPPLSSDRGYVYYYLGGAELIFEDQTVPAGQVKKIFSTQKIAIQH